MSPDGSFHLQLTSVLSPELSRGPFPHYLYWVHQPSKGTSGAKPLLRRPQAKSPSCGQQQVHEKTHAPSAGRCTTPSLSNLLPLCPPRWTASASHLGIFQESVIPRALASDSRGHAGRKGRHAEAPPGEGVVAEIRLAEETVRALGGLERAVQCAPVLAREAPPKAEPGARVPARVPAAFHTR